MVINVTCPHCRQQLRADRRSAGQDAVCPRCSGTVRVPNNASQPRMTVSGITPAGRPVAPAIHVATGPVSLQVPEEDTGPASAAGHWRVVAGGLGAILAGLLGLLVAVALFGAAQARLPLVSRWPILEIAGLVVAAGSMLLVLAGRVACCWAPASGARGLAIASVVFLILGGCGVVLALLLSAGGGSRATEVLAWALGSVGMVTAEVGFVWYFHQVAASLDDDELRRQVRKLLNLLLYFAGACLLAGLAGIVCFGWATATASLLAPVVLAFGGLFWPARYLCLLFTTRATLLRREVLSPSPFDPHDPPD
jgi:hypothetical protein